MNHPFLRITLLFICLCISSNLVCQNDPGGNSPSRTKYSPLFGKDIIIHDQPQKTQDLVTICEAFNGWLFAAHTFDTDSTGPKVAVFKSTDQGITWSQFFDFGWCFTFEVPTRLDIAVTGDSLSNLKLFIALVYRWYDPNFGYSEAFVRRYNGITGEYEEEVLQEPCTWNDVYDLVLCGKPGAPTWKDLGMLYSKEFYSDSVVFRSSNDGGMTFHNRKVVAYCDEAYGRVSGAYGSSQTYSNGSFFAAWEKLKNHDSVRGSIYTSRTQNSVAGSFSTPRCLDSLDVELSGLCSKPVISAQFGDFDNDSANISELILFEKYNKDVMNHKIFGFYNLNGATKNTFHKFLFSPENSLQPSLDFNPFNKTFIATYFNASNHKLPFVQKDFNFQNPSIWETVSGGYNDESNLSDPDPVVKMSLYQQNGIMCWKADRPNGKKEALYDFAISTYTGIDPGFREQDVLPFSIFPDPCQEVLNIDIRLARPATISILLYNSLGQVTTLKENEYLCTGRSLILLPLRDISSGPYVLILKNKNQVIGKRKLIKQ
jgi:hypothetical protein